MEKKTTLTIELNTNNLREGNQLIKKMLSALDPKEIDLIKDCNLSQTVIDMCSEDFEELNNAENAKR